MQAVSLSSEPIFVTYKRYKLHPHTKYGESCCFLMDFFALIWRILRLWNNFPGRIRRLLFRTAQTDSKESDDNNPARELYILPSLLHKSNGGICGLLVWILLDLDILDLSIHPAWSISGSKSPRPGGHSNSHISNRSYATSQIYNIIIQRAHQTGFQAINLSAHSRSVQHMVFNDYLIRQISNSKRALDSAHPHRWAWSLQESINLI